MAYKTAIINVMERAAVKASRRLLRDFGEVEQLQVSRKGPADFVSNADLRAKQTIMYELRRARPDFGFLAEESGEEKGADPDRRWIIDPIDGTTNYLHGIPHFAISIALEERGELVAGLIHDPCRDETFWADKGIGAHLNTRRIRVSARGKLADAVFATGIPFKGRDGHAGFLAILESIMGQVAGVRRFGSAALDMAYVAAGRYDGFWEDGLKYWDVAAGIVIMREAGGFVTDYSGGTRKLKDGEIIAANDRLHPELERLVKRAVKAAASEDRKSASG